MRTLRTPDDRFTDLPGFPYEPRYAQVPDQAGGEGTFRVACVEAGPRPMPGLVPAEPDDPEAPANRAAWDVLNAWEKPFLAAFSDQDPVTGPMAPIFRQMIPGAKGRTHPTLEGAGHFLQEDAGERLGHEIAGFVRATPA